MDHSLLGRNDHKRRSVVEELMKPKTTTSRRDFLADAGRSLPAIALGSTLGHPVSALLALPTRPSPADWDLSWIDKLKGATDKAVCAGR